MAKEMTELIAKNVLGPDLRDWVMPSFTATTDCDKVIGAVLLMSAMQRYFTYKTKVSCGIPSVTLLRDVEDWREILGRLDQLGHEEPSLFARMLRPILSHLVLSFEQPAAAEVVHFWNTIVHKYVMGSGTDYLTGWLTAFCFWDEKGEAKRMDKGTLFGDTSYPRFDIDKVPLDFASVPVKIDYYGHRFDATMVAGSVGVITRASATPPLLTEDAQPVSTDNLTAVLDTLQPLSGWWIYENEGAETRDEREAKVQRLQDECTRILSALLGKGERRDHSGMLLVEERLRELKASIN